MKTRVIIDRNVAQREYRAKRKREALAGQLPVIHEVKDRARHDVPRQHCPGVLAFQILYGKT